MNVSLSLQGKPIDDNMRGRGKETCLMSAVPQCDSGRQCYHLQLRQLMNTVDSLSAVCRDWCRAHTWDQQADVAKRVQAVCLRLKSLHDMSVEADLNGLWAALEELRVKVREEQHRLGAARLDAWKRSMGDPHRAIKYVNHTETRHVASLKTMESAETITAYDELDNEMRIFWAGIAAPDSCDLDAAEAQCVAGAKEAVQQAGCGSILHDCELSVKGFRAAVQLAKRRTAAGPIGWQAWGLQALPDAALSELLQVVALARLKGRTPRRRQSLWITHIPKGDEIATMMQIRPIAVYSLLWRVIFRCITKECQGIEQDFLLKVQYGPRRGGSTSFPLARARRGLDAARRQGEPYAVLQLDVAKFFNAVSADAAVAALRDLGLPPDLSDMLSYHYKHLEQRCRLPLRCVGKPFHLPRGVPQGGPWSVMAANIMMRLALRVLPPDAQAHLAVYVDDVFFFGRDVKVLQKYAQTLILELGRMGFQVALQKCGCALCG